ncbi:MAG: dipeptide/oligopeptide/nickel ABC transporter permease/ATP-binding protein [Armatimonadota bacterium]
MSGAGPAIGNTLWGVLRAPTGAAALGAVMLLIALAIAGPVVWGSRARHIDVTRSQEAPSPDHLLGTDRLGRDILARTLAAARMSLGLALAAAATAALIGLPFGALITLLGHRVRNIGLRVIEVLLAFPPILLAIFVTAIIGPGAGGAVLAIGIAFSPYFARLANTLASAAVGREYVASARVIGVRPHRLLTRYVLPNIADTLAITTFNAVASSLIAVSSLSFLGLGVQPPQFDWGSMLTEGVNALYATPAAALAPAFVIAIAGLSMGFLGEALARAMNPLLWTAPQGAARHGPGARNGAASDLPTAPAASVLTGSIGPPARRAVLRVEGLTVRFPTPRRVITPVRDVSFAIGAGEIVGVVGESGCGKSLTALALAHLVPYPGVVSARTLELRGVDLLRIGSRGLHETLGTNLAMIFQDPLSSLNPALRVGGQLIEAPLAHGLLDASAARRRAVALMRDVHIPAPEMRMRQYPHEFSGGMSQRAMIAMALMRSPSLIIADEPTTALDVTVQAQIIDVLQEVNQRHGTAIVLISHDIGVISEICSRVLVMYAGRVVEDADVKTLLRDPAHPYTQALIAAVPGLEGDRAQPLAAIPGRLPDLDAIPPGCAFAPRCPFAVDRCRTDLPLLEEFADDRRVACWVARDRLVKRTPA